MFITKKKHNQIIKDKDYTISCCLKEVNSLKSDIEKGHTAHLEIVAGLKKELEEARNLKLIIEKLYPLYSIEGSIFTSSNGSWSLNLPDDVLRYTDDILGGKVIKQEGTKCLMVDKDGNVKTGLTKQKADKGYNYKLVRE